MGSRIYAHIQIFLIIVIILQFLQCSSNQKKSKNVYNHLAHETSPYLQQHAKNPVDWYPWGEQALEKAKKENKLLLISIGYSACHWCHVMEKESFEDTAVAKVMNEYFVSIKVDREERPDVDDVYMNACQITTGNACGWPLNAIALPNGNPVWAGTYFPKKRWIEILNYFIEAKKNEIEKLSQYADQIQQRMVMAESIDIPDTSGNWDVPLSLISDMGRRFLMNFDLEYGGLVGAPKFPMPNNYLMLMRLYHLTGDDKLLESLEITLHQMAYGGIYDQIGGGFARYSVDSEWKVPHFEKMLYDNAQLLSLYAQAYKLTGRKLYRQIIDQTVSWLQREMVDPGTQGFYSSLDADSEGEEGKFYVWTWNELQEVVSDKQDLEIISAYFRISPTGNWEEGKNILWRTSQVDSVAIRYNLSAAELEKKISNLSQQLFEARTKRIRPGTDDKILTSWNGLLIQGLVDAYESTGEVTQLKMAQDCMAFIDNKLSDESRLWRTYKEGKAHISGFLDDYAHYIQASLALYQVTFNEGYLDQAKSHLDYAIQYFLDEQTSLFHYTSDLDDPLIVRKKETLDNVIPSSNATMAHNLILLGHLLANQEYLDLAEKMCAVLQSEILETTQPDFYSKWIINFLNLSKPPYEVAIVGPQALQIANEMNDYYLPGVIYLGGEEEGTLPLLEDKLVEGETTIYVCQNKVCKLPVTEIKDALRLID